MYRYFVSSGLIFVFVGKIPGVEESCFGYFYHFFPVQPVGVVRRLVVIGMSVCVVPDDGDVAQGKRSIVTSSRGAVPGAVVRLQAQAVACNVLLQPVAEYGVGGGVEVDNVLRLLGLIVTAYHVEIEITFHLADERTALYKVF